MINKIEEKEIMHYAKILITPSPLEAGLNRVMVVQLVEEMEESETMEIPGMVSLVKQGSIFIPKESKQKLAKEDVVKAVVTSVGPSRDNSPVPFQVNQVVLVNPSVFETKITIGELDYFTYGHMDIVAIVNLNQ